MYELDGQRGELRSRWPVAADEYSEKQHWLLWDATIATRLIVNYRRVLVNVIIYVPGCVTWYRSIRLGSYKAVIPEGWTSLSAKLGEARPLLTGREALLMSYQLTPS